MAFCVALLCTMAGGQPSATLEFEAASVKLVDAGRSGSPSRRVFGGPGTASPGQITYTEQSLKDLLFMAYRVQFYQLDMPSWMEERYFNVVARMPAGATKEDVPRMLQRLLAERFRIKIHHESREVQGYVLIAGKNGPTLNISPTASTEPAVGSDPNKSPRFGVDKDGFIIVPPGRPAMMTLPTKNGVTRLTGAGETMGVLAGYLSRELQESVLDQTGLSGAYDFHLAFAPGQLMSPVAPQPMDRNDGSGALPQASDPAPILTKAVESQLGLKMERRKVPVDILIIDHAEKTPIEN